MVAADPEVLHVRVGDNVLVSGVIDSGRCPAYGRDLVRCSRGPTLFGSSRDLDGGQAEDAAEQAELLTDFLPTGYLGAAEADIAPHRPLSWSVPTFRPH